MGYWCFGIVGMGLGSVSFSPETNFSEILGMLSLIMLAASVSDDAFQERLPGWSCFFGPPRISKTTYKLFKHAKSIFS